MCTEGGTGLGLAIGKQYAKLLGGDISVDSTLGSGATFTLRMCARLAPIEAMAKHTAAPSVLRLAENQPVPRILVADDNLSNRELLEEILTPVGFEVQLVQNGREAITAFDTWKPHAIIMDMRMPVMDGIEATRLIKAKTDGHSTFILALSASAFEEDKATVLAAGADVFMRKPFRDNELLASLGERLKLHYIYAETKHPVPTRDEPKPKRFSSPIPESVRAALIAACAEADYEKLIELCNSLSRSDPTAAGSLRAMVEAFDYESLKRLMEADVCG
jgi:CheY-like chemotaxis protein